MLSVTLSGKTYLVPILAHPVDHVKAPSIYNPAFAAAGLDWCQVPMGVHPDDLLDTLSVLLRMRNVQGVNLTIPHKAAAYGVCRWLGPEAQRTGVVNSLRRTDDGHWAGESFDGQGFVAAACAHQVWPEQGSVFLVGAGGAGTAIAWALLATGVRSLYVTDIDPARATHLAQTLQTHWHGVDIGTHASALAEADLVVNASPMGLHADDPLPFDPDNLSARACVFDIIAARETELLNACRARGVRAVSGRPMIDHQVQAQMAFWAADLATLHAMGFQAHPGFHSMSSS